MKERWLFVIGIIIVVAFTAIGIAKVHAADIMLEGTISSVTQKVSSNGSAYTLITLPVSKELNGVKYTTDLSVFCFKSKDASKYKTGDPVKMIAKQTRSKDGNEFITLITFIK